MKGVIVSAEGASYLSPGQHPGSGEVGEAPTDAPPTAGDFDELLDEFLEAHLVAPAASSAPPEDPPTVQEVLDLLYDRDQAHRGGHLEHEEFQARKKELLARIRRGRS